MQTIGSSGHGKSSSLGRQESAVSTDIRFALSQLDQKSTTWDRRRRWEFLIVSATQIVIDWKRARSIFDDPKPPASVWERQFDDFDNELKELATTPHDEIDFGDLWYYHHDLAYVELQPEVFAYLFPVCLMDWHLTLKSNEGCSHGDSEFHYGLLRGNVLAKMTTPTQRMKAELQGRGSGKVREFALYG